MIFKLDTWTCNDSIRWNQEIAIELQSQNGTTLNLRAVPGNPELQLNLPGGMKTFNCLKKDFSYFRLPEQLVLRTGSRSPSSGMNAEPIVLDLPADLDIEDLIKALRILTLH